MGPKNGMKKYKIPLLVLGFPFPVFESRKCPVLFMCTVRSTNVLNGLPQSRQQNLLAPVNTVLYNLSCKKKNIGSVEPATILTKPNAEMDVPSYFTPVLTTVRAPARSISGLQTIPQVYSKR